MRTPIITLLSLGLLALPACGDEDGSSRLVLLLTDAPGEFQQVPIDIAGMQVHFMGAEVANRAQYQRALAAGEAYQVQNQNQVQSGEPQGQGEGQMLQLMTRSMQQDLLQLRDGKTAALADVELPAGYYARLRLMLAGAQVVVDGQQHQLAAGGTAIELRFKFQLEAGQGHEMVLDFDAQKSIQQGAEGGYALQPYVEVKQFRYTHRYNCEGASCNGAEQPSPGVCADQACQQGDSR
jgi:hypothetical protein